MRLLLEIISLRGKPFNPEAYSKKSGVPVPNLYRYLTTFLDCGILIRPRRGEYLPHPEFLSSLSAFSDHDVLKNVVRPELERLVKKLPVTLHFGVLEAEMVTYLIKVTKSEELLFTKENMQLEAYCSGIGKVLLAALPQASLKDYLSGGVFPNLTPHTITNPKKIGEEVAKTKKRGYGVDDREVHEKLVCIAVPVTSSKGAVLGAISAASTSVDLLGGMRAGVLKQLHDSADRIGKVF